MTKARIIQQLERENTIANKISETEDGDFKYEAKLNNGYTIEFFVPKRHTFLKGRTSRLETLEPARFLTRFIVINK